MFEYKELPTLIAQTDRYFIFADKELAPYGVFFSELIETYFEISAKNKLILELHSDKGLPVIRVYEEVQFRGKKNEWEGRMSVKCASVCLTILLQKHLVFTLSNAPDFTNKPLLQGLIDSSDYLKNNAKNLLNDDEVQTLYYFLD
jgi:hypothetical protein